MPRFSYICNDCGNEFDLLIGVTAETTEEQCKHCDSKNIERTFSTFNIGSSSVSSSSSGNSCSTGTCPF